MDLPGPGAGGWSKQLFHLLVLAGAATVVVGSYSTWATFYAGLIARNGLPGHGKYFIGMAVAAGVAALLPSIRGVWGGLRWLALPAGLVIAAIALRDLHNLDALVQNLEAAFYVPGRGNGLLIVIAGATILALAPLARPVSPVPAAAPIPTLIALVVVVGVGMLIPGLYGEYYLHFSGGHGLNHTDPLNTAHLLTVGGAFLLTVGGAFLLIAVSHGALVRAARRRQQEAASAPLHRRGA
jgi:hypothetical protein